MKDYLPGHIIAESWIMRLLHNLHKPVSGDAAACFCLHNRRMIHAIAGNIHLAVHSDDLFIPLEVISREYQKISLPPCGFISDRIAIDPVNKKVRYLLGQENQIVFTDSCEVSADESGTCAKVALLSREFILGNNTATFQVNYNQTDDFLLIIKLAEDFCTHRNFSLLSNNSGVAVICPDFSFFLPSLT